MDSIIFKKLLDEKDRITGLEIGGMLVLENSLQLKKEFADAVNYLSGKVNIVVSSVEEIDLSCIQLFLAFIKLMHESHVNYRFDWKLEDDQRTLLENVGFSNELFLN